MGPRAVWTGAENLALTGIRSPDRPTRSQSLYRPRYPAHLSDLTLLLLCGLLYREVSHERKYRVVAQTTLSWR